MPEMCPHCGCTINQGRHPTVIVPSNSAFLSREMYEEIARAISRHPISSRDLAAWVNRRIYRSGASFVDEDGNPYRTGRDEVENSFPDAIDRWFRGVRQRVEGGIRQSPQENIVPRLKFIWMAIEVERQLPAEFKDDSWDQR